MADVGATQRRTGAWPRASLAAVTAGSLPALAAAAFDWTLLDWFPGLLFLPLHTLFTYLLLLGASIWALVEALRVRRRGSSSLAPAAICAIAWALLAWVPFTPLWLAANFWFYRDARTEIVRRVGAGALTPNVTYNPTLIALDGAWPNVSAGGNMIKIDLHDGKPWVLFFTFRGAPNHYSGFLHAPEGADVARFADLGDRRHQIVRYAPSWYFVAR